MFEQIIKKHKQQNIIKISKKRGLWLFKRPIINDRTAVTNKTKSTELNLNEKRNKNTNNKQKNIT